MNHNNILYRRRQFLLLFFTQGFATLIREWPGELYNNMAIVQAVNEHLKKDPTNSMLLTTLAELWVNAAKLMNFKSGSARVRLILYVCMQLHIWSALWSCSGDLPETETQRCLPTHSQTQPILRHQGQDCPAHGFRQRGKTSMWFLCLTEDLCFRI